MGKHRGPPVDRWQVENMTGMAALAGAPVHRPRHARPMAGVTRADGTPETGASRPPRRGRHRWLPLPGAWREGS